MEKNYGNLRKPAREGHGRNVQLFCVVHKYSTSNSISKVASFKIASFNFFDHFSALPIALQHRARGGTHAATSRKSTDHCFKLLSTVATQPSKSP
jgi:hypothetical protein